MTITKFPAIITNIRQLSPDTKSFILETQEMSWKPGQFVMINVPFKDTFIRRAYSIASATKVEMCLNLVKGGKASEFLCNATEGTELEIDGPYGIFTLKENSNNKVFICTGTGVAPLRPMIQFLLNNKAKENITLIFGKRSEEDLLYREEFEQCAEQHDNFIYIPILSKPHDDWKGKNGYVQDALTIADNTDYYICGLKEMVNDTKAKLESQGIKPENIFVERYV
jgi:NAD(P)H-flavin reductase